MVELHPARPLRLCLTVSGSFDERVCATYKANSFTHSAVNSAAIHELSKEPPPFEKKFEIHIALLRWQTILPPPLKPAETYWRPPEDIEDPDLRGEVHSSTMFVYAPLVVLSGSWVGSVASGLVRPRTRKIGLPADWWSRLDRQ